MQNASRDYAERMRRLKGKVYASGTPYIPATEKGAENMLVRLESQNPFRGLTPTGVVVEESCCSSEPVPLFTATIYSANPEAGIGVEPDCIPYETLQGLGRSDAFVVKYDTSGQAQWAARLGGKLEDNSITVTSYEGDYCCIAGIFTSSDFQIYDANDSLVGSLTNAGGRCIFIVNYDLNGNPTWWTHITDIGTNIFGLGLASNSNNIFITSSFTSDAITLNSKVGDNTVVTLTKFTGAVSCGFLASYDVNGVVSWGVTIDPLVDKAVRCEGICASDNDIYVTGAFSSETQFNSTPVGSITLFFNANSESNAFLVKYSAAGVPAWATKIGGDTPNKSDSGIAVAVDNSGVYVTGYYETDPAIVYSTDSGQLPDLANTGGSSIFLAQYDTGGIAQWATRIDAPGSTELRSQPNSITVTDTTVSILCQIATGNAAYYNAPGGISDNTESKIYTPILTGSFVTYDKTNGAYVRSLSTGGDTSSTTLGYAITHIDTDIYISGLYNASPLLIESAGGSLYEMKNDGAFDGCIIKYNGDGTVNWRTRIGGASEQGNIGGVSCPSGSGIYVVGFYGIGLA